MTDAIQLTPETESRFLFWSAPDEALFLPAIAAAVIDCTPDTLANWRSADSGPRYYKRGVRIYYRKRDVIDWITAEKVAA